MRALALFVRCYRKNEIAQIARWLLFSGILILVLAFFARERFLLILTCVFGASFTAVGVIFSIAPPIVSMRYYHYARAKLKLEGPGWFKEELSFVGHCAEVGMKMAKADLDRS